MRRILFISASLLILVFSSSFAGNITPEQATRVARNHVTFMASTGEWDAGANATVRLERMLEADGEIIGYYVEVEPDGYLLIPAFRELPPVKAYAEHGRLSFDHPESPGAWLLSILRQKAQVLERYPDRDAMARDGIDMEAVDRYSRLWDVFTEPSATAFISSLGENQLDEYTPGQVLLDCLWHQGPPFNIFCPVIDREYAWVGCAATAAAQIMHYWQWPQAGEGSHSYQWENQTLSADFSDPYDWDNILPTYGQPWQHTVEEMTAVAELCYETGVSFEMNYGLDGSGIPTANVDIIRTAFREFFHYKEGMDFEYRIDFENQEDWFAMLCAEINIERPMWHYITGHAIVTDGWRISNTINQIHINYGFGGPWSTWYALDAIPGSDDPLEEFVLRGIEPDIVPDQPMEWTAQPVTQSFSRASCVYAADIDGDGDNDLLACANLADDITWWENLDGAGSDWSAHPVNTEFDGPQSVTAADIDNDGDMDVIGAAASGDQVVCWLNMNGSGTGWITRVVDASFNGASGVEVADIDGDGDLDIAGVAYDAGRVSWWENVNGTGSTWSEHSVAVNVAGARTLDLADMDNDGDADVLVAAYLADEISWWENTSGTGLNWTEHVVATGINGAFGVVAGDLDNDGDLDVAGTLNLADQVMWWENTDGSGTSWTAGFVDIALDGANCVNVADLDNDGDLDLYGSATYADDITWWANVDGDGSTWAQYRLDTCYEGASWAYASDLNGDGSLDIAGTASITNQLTVWTQSESHASDPIQIELVPTSTPTIVPRGDSFDYDLTLSVNSTQPSLGYVWTTATLPNGNLYGPVFSVQFLFTPGMEINVDGIAQEVPAFAPTGDYRWTLNAGPNLQHAAGTGSFPFTVIAGNGEAVQGAGEWTSNGANLITLAANGEGATEIAAVAAVNQHPHEFAISAVYPNPFNAATTITVNLPETSELSVTVYNIAGQQVAELANGSVSAGTHRFTFDASQLASGLYFVRAFVPGKSHEIRKLMLVR
ncbi:C10 family peptidase [bacterium]|nr:C10 family peptidase [bacterium]